MKVVIVGGVAGGASAAALYYTIKVVNTKIIKL